MSASKASVETQNGGPLPNSTKIYKAGKIHPDPSFLVEIPPGPPELVSP